MNPAPPMTMILLPATDVIAGNRGARGGTPLRRHGRQEEPVPPLEAEEGPDQEPMIGLGAGVLLQDALDVGRLEVVVDQGVSSVQHAADVVQAFTPVPGLVRPA